MKLERPDLARIAVVALFAILFGGVAALALRPRAPGGAVARGGGAQGQEGLPGADDLPGAPGDGKAPPGAPEGPPRTSAPRTLPPRAPSMSELPAPPTLPAAIVGRVVDASGAGVEDAAVDVLPFGAARPADPFGAQGVTRTGRDGRFAVLAAPLIRGDLQVAASRVGFLEGRSGRLAHASATALPLDAGDIAVRSAGAGRLRPHFRERDGGPLAGEVEVGLVAQDGSASPARGTARFTSDAQGVGRPDRALTAGFYRLTARLEGFEAATVPVTVGGEGALCEPEVVLTRATGLSVQVVDDESGLPVAGVALKWGPPGGDSQAEEVATDSEGRARVRAPPATAIQLALRLRLFDQRGWRVEGGAEGFDLERGPVLTTPPAGRAETIVVRLTSGYSISGAVRDFAGRPVAGARVVAVQGDAPASTTETGEDGEYAFSGLDRRAGAEPVTLLARHGGFSWGHATATLSPEAARAHVDLVLGAEEATLAVTVTGPGGAPVEGVLLAVGVPGEARVAAVAGVTDAGGRSRIAGLAPGTVDVLASHEALPDALRRGVPLRAGENALEIALAAGATITGVVADAAGAPPRKGGYVVASRDEDPAAGPVRNGSAKIQADGTFRIEGLADEAYVLDVLAGGYAARRVPHVRPGGDLLRVTVVPAFALELVLRAPEGVPLPGRVTVTVDEGAYASEQTLPVRPDGVVGPLEKSGAVEVRVAASGYLLASAPVPSQPAEGVRRIEVRMDRARAVRGRALLPGGAPAVGAGVRATSVADGEDARPFESVETVDDGRFTLTMAPREGIVVEVRAPATAAASGGFGGHVTLPAGSGDIADVVIHLERLPDAEPGR